MNISTEKMCNLLLPTLNQSVMDGTVCFKAGAAVALSNMSPIIGVTHTSQKVFPILVDLLKDDSSEVKLKVVEGLTTVA